MNMQYKEIYDELMDSKDLFVTMIKYDNPKNKTLLIRVLKYFTWNIIIDMKKRGIKDKFVLPSEFKLREFELDRSRNYLQLNEDLRFSINERSIDVFERFNTFFNTDATNILPVTGRLLELSKQFLK